MADKLEPIDLSELIWDEIKYNPTQAKTVNASQSILYKKQQPLKYIVRGRIEQSSEPYTFAKADNILGLFRMQKDSYSYIQHGTFGNFFGRLTHVYVYKFEGKNYANVWFQIRYIGTTSTHKRGFNITSTLVTNDWNI